MRKTKTKSQKLEKDNGLNCQYCGKDFKYESERKRHEQSHSPQFACKVCNKKFSFISALRRHEKQHERTGTVSCVDCNRTFRDESLLKRHIKYAHKGTFICSKCETTFSSDLALRSHIKIHKPESERKFRCSFEGCTKTFNFAHHLKHHELTHTNTKQHFCTICGKGFIQYHHLKSHRKTHEPESWLHCSVSSCNKKFSTIYALKRHLSTSTHRDVKDESTSDTESVSADTKDISSKVGDEYIELENIDAKTFSDTVFTETDTFDSCSQIDLKAEFLQYESKQSGNEMKNGHSKFYQNDKEENDALQKANSFDELPVGNCKSYLGGCIMGEDLKSNHNCLCAQIEPNAIAVQDVYEFVEEQIDPSVNSKQKIVAELNQINIINDCEGCDCMTNLELNNTNVSDKNIKVKLNEIEDIIDYKPNGTIKIKEMSDIDLFISTSDKGKIAHESVPFNSCKAVLGTCIVSGNGVIGEGCLCAKMSMNDQQLLDYEIEELTPCPKT